jgi:hypothetical protein
LAPGAKLAATLTATMLGERAGKIAIGDQIVKLGRPNTLRLISPACLHRLPRRFDLPGASV